MRVLLDLTPVGRGRSDGTETYVRELIAGLDRQMSPDDRIVAVAWPGLALPRLQRVDLIQGSAAGPARVARRLRGWRLPPLSEIVQAEDPDVVHMPTGWPDLSGVSEQCRVVLTLLDAKHADRPEDFDPAELSTRRRIFSAACRRADRIITISEFSAASIRRTWGVDGTRIVTIPLGCAPHADAPARVWRFPGRRPRRPFAYYPAADWPNKNHWVLLEAWRSARSKGGVDGLLVLSGFRSPSWQTLWARADRQGLTDHVIDLSRVPRQRVLALLRDARLLVFPSLYEGFGLPVLEAMSAGTAVASSNRASLPEVGGDAAVYFDPDDPDGMADAIARLWKDDALRARVVARGRARAAAFSWDAVARDTLRVYRDVLGEERC